MRPFAALRRFGHRSSVLTGYSLICVAYGTGLLTGYRPTFAAALGVPVTVFGWAFIATGMAVATGAFREHDGLHYALAVMATSAWAILISTHWTAPVGWAAAVSWDGIALGLLLASAWPNAPRRVQPPPLPALEELTGTRERQ